VVLRIRIVGIHIVVRCETAANTTVMISVKAQGENAEPIISERKKSAGLSQVFGKMLGNLSKGVEVYLFCPTDDKKRSK